MSESAVMATVLRGQEVGVIKIKDIVIEHRQRTLVPETKEFKEWMEHIANLASSIKRIGLIHPITLEDETNKLVTGFCRIHAFLHMGLDEIPFLRRSQLSETDRKVMEAEENLQRLGISFADKVKAIAEIDALQRKLAAERGETWTTEKSATLTGLSVGTVSQAKKVVEHAALDPSVLNASGLVAALAKIKTGEQLERRKKDIEHAAAGRLNLYPAEIIQGDALELIRKEPDASFDAVITNFPFGVELTLGKEQKEIYKDDEDYIIKLVQAVTHECYRVLKDDSWMVAFFDIRKITYSNKHREYVNASLFILNEMLKRGQIPADTHIELTQLAFESLGLTYWMEEAGFDYVQLLPCIWAKPNKTQGAIGDPNKGFIMAYEAFVLAGKGNPVLMKKGRQNLWVFDTLLGGERDIDVQMPISICSELVSTVCLGGSHILDPFAGSGAIGEGALNNQCSFRGYELDPKRAEIGNLRLRENIHAKGGKADMSVPENKEWLERVQASMQRLRDTGAI